MCAAIFPQIIRQCSCTLGRRKRDMALRCSHCFDRLFAVCPPTSRGAERQQACDRFHKETWDDAVSGKTVFVKFFAAWCGHCKKMKPDWDKLMKEHSGSKDILIADVDCTAGGKSKCEEVGVRGYPTIKYGDPDDLQDYKGGRSFDDLSKFAKGLGPQCGPGNKDIQTVSDKDVEAIKSSGLGLLKSVHSYSKKQKGEL
eukprot:s4979_g2.t1